MGLCDEEVDRERSRVMNDESGERGGGVRGCRVWLYTHLNLTPSNGPLLLVYKVETTVTANDKT